MEVSRDPTTRLPRVHSTQERGRKWSLRQRRPRPGPRQYSPAWPSSLCYTKKGHNPELAPPFFRPTKKKEDPSHPDIKLSGKHGSSPPYTFLAPQFRVSNRSRCLVVSRLLIVRRVLGIFFSSVARRIFSWVCGRWYRPDSTRR